MRDNWEMPTPVFRTSEGEDIGASITPTLETPVDERPELEHETLEPSTPAAIAPENEVLASLYAPPEGFTEKEEVVAAPVLPAADIEAQPYVSEQFTAEEIVVETPKPAAPVKQNSGGSALKVLLGLVLIAIVGSLGAFLYWFFMTKPPE